MSDYTRFTPTGEKIMLEIKKIFEAKGITGMVKDLPDHWTEGLLSEDEILKFFQRYNNRKEL